MPFLGLDRLSFVMEDPTLLGNAWASAVAHTRSRSPSTFEQWFSGVQLDAFEDGELQLAARDEFVRDWVQDHYIPDLLGHLEAESGIGKIRVRWRVQRTLNCPVSEPPPPTPSHAAAAYERQSVRPTSLRVPTPTTFPPPSERSPSEFPSSVRPERLVNSARAETIRPGSDRRPSRAPFALELVADRGERVYGESGPRSDRCAAINAEVWAQLDPKFTFENFIVGNSNELAYAAAHAAAGGGGVRYNPLFIAGGTGLGKTHLVHAIAQQVLIERPMARVIYVSAERFTNEFIVALQHRKMDEFRNRYRSHCDVLLVDDIQFLAGREQTQEEFFHTFNALREADRQIVVTADKYPQQLQRMPERLVSRFTSGLVADVQVPQLETRVAIVRKKAALMFKSRDITLPTKVRLVKAMVFPVVM
ncbi:MAG TPA: DnaA/Hda family protein, partial [Polyangiaceae bacterium]